MLKRIIKLQTHDINKIVQIESLYEVQGYLTMVVRVRSGPFRGESRFCVSRERLQVFAKEIGDLGKRLNGNTILHDYDSDAFISIEGIGGFGRTKKELYPHPASVV